MAKAECASSSSFLIHSAPASGRRQRLEHVVAAAVYVCVYTDMCSVYVCVYTYIGTYVDVSSMSPAAVVACTALGSRKNQADRSRQTEEGRQNKADRTREAEQDRQNKPCPFWIRLVTCLSPTGEVDVMRDWPDSGSMAACPGRRSRGSAITVACMCSRVCRVCHGLACT